MEEQGEHKYYYKECTTIYTSRLSQYYEKFPPTPASAPIQTYVSGRNYDQLPHRSLFHYLQLTDSSTTRIDYRLEARTAFNVTACSSELSSCTLRAFKNKWTQVNSLINLSNMLIVLNKNISLLQSYHSNSDLLTGSVLSFHPPNH